MARFKDFGSNFDSAKKEDISFKLYEEEFFCIPAIQGKLLLSLVSESSSDDPVKSSGVIEKFFSHVLTDESLERFNILLESKEKIVSMETLAEITGWIVEQYSERPEEQPEV